MTPAIPPLEVGASGPTGGDDGTGGYMPLAIATGANADIKWVHSHHNAKPLVLTNASGAVVAYSGHAVLGFPGQFANAVGLAGAQYYYNRYRDYNDATGRYIQADPIGLAGDANPYAYAMGNPLRYSDPTGEFAWLIPMAVGAAVGAGTDLAIQAAITGLNGGNVFNLKCYNWRSIGVSAGLGAIGGGLSKAAFLSLGPKSLTRVTGLEWSHAISRRTVDKMPSFLRGLMNQRGGLNGSWVSPQRHFMHDPFRWPLGHKQMGNRLSPLLQRLDRIPDWLKSTSGGGVATGMIGRGLGGPCGC